MKLKPHLLLLAVILFSCGCSTALNKNWFRPSPSKASQSTNEKVNDRVSEGSESYSDSIPANDNNGELKTTTNVKLSKQQKLEAKAQTVLDEALEYCRASQDFWQKGEFENAIQALDQAYSLIIRADTYDSTKIIQQKEDIRFMISKRILEIYASRHIVANGNHNAIPITINKHVQIEIDRFTKGPEKKFFREAYKRSGRYRSMMLKEIKQAGLPEALSWLPLIESGFKTRALSKARALGLWQFIPSTGYKFGLKRDLYIDERLDPDKSTEAAIAFLKELHQIFGDWTTALAAYNCGPARVLRIIRSQNVNYLDNFWDLYQRLPSETARYVPKFLATLHIVNNLEKYGIDVTVDPPVEYKTVDVERRIRLKDISNKIGVNEKVLRELNPELRYNLLPESQYKLKVPPSMQQILLSKINEIPVASPPRPAYVYHRVRSGETLSTIAERYRTSTSRIARANNIRRKNFIVAGKLLKIPQKGTYIAPVKKQNKKYKRPSHHVVKRGDSLWIIARRYGTTTRKIQELNNLSSANLHVGQVLEIPRHKSITTASAASGNLKTYVVRQGDSPYAIAVKHNMTLRHFLSLNSLTARSTIYPGQSLLVK